MKNLKPGDKIHVRTSIDNGKSWDKTWFPMDVLEDSVEPILTLGDAETGDELQLHVMDRQANGVYALEYELIQIKELMDE
jgi:hypothetical protein